jgi:hypothetical protein
MHAGSRVPLVLRLDPPKEADHAVDGAFELDEALRIRADGSTEFRRQASHHLHLIRDGVECSHKIVVRHFVSVRSATRRGPPTARVRALMRNWFKVTCCRCAAGACAGHC